MSLDTHQAFQEQVFRALGFAPAPCAFGTRWSNAAEPARGSCHVCQHADSYSLTVADYHVTAPFSLAQHHFCTSAVSTKATPIFTSTALNPTLLHRSAFW